MQIVDIEQGSYEWHCLRQGKVTGTTLKSALGSPKVQQTLMYKLIAERMTEPQIDDLNTQSASRGREVEPVARKFVIQETGISFEETGMMLSDSIHEFGLSPDAVYFEEGVIVGGLEIKCPDSKKHIEYLCTGGVPKEYIDQVKAPFILDDCVKWWYFASFDDRNYERPLMLHRVTRSDYEEIEKDREKLSAFLEKTHEAHTALTF